MTGPPGPPGPPVPSDEEAAAEIKQRALKSAGQREISVVWEGTQRLIALSVTWAALSVAIFLTTQSLHADVVIASTVFLYGVANLVIGFYFGRTNHSRVPGEGSGTRDS